MNIRTVYFLLLAVLFLYGPVQADDAVFPYEYPIKNMGADIFATVNEDSIAMQTLLQATRQAVRAKFYHRQADAQQLVVVRSEVAAELIDARLLILEAKQRGISVDNQAIDSSVQAYDKQLNGLESGMEAQQRKNLLKEKRVTLLAQFVLPELRQEVETDVVATEDNLRTYYENNDDKFTQPSRHRLSMILLRVAPSASSNQWQAAFEKAETLYEKTVQGNDFSQLAEKYSDHESASSGGDLGFIHQGMLVDTLQQRVDQLAVGELTHPIWTLQGIIIFQLNERTEPKLLTFENARTRIQELWLRAKRQQLWRQFVAGLREKYAANVVINRLAMH